MPADSNQFVIRTRVPKGELTDEMIASRARSANLSAGDYLIVQCFDHEYEVLLHEAEYRIVERRSQRRVIEINDRDSKQVDEITITIARVRPWWTSPAGAMQDADERKLLGDDAADFDVKVQPGSSHSIKWNLGKQKYEVRDPAGEVVAEARSKDEAMAMLQKAAAA